MMTNAGLVFGHKILRLDAGATALLQILNHVFV
jgi:hypothetical protein